jgi:uncharacterized membrane protein YedE/YeeE
MYVYVVLGCISSNVTQITHRYLKLHHCVATTINHWVNSTTDLFIVTVRAVVLILGYETVCHRKTL